MIKPLSFSKVIACLLALTLAALAGRELLPERRIQLDGTSAYAIAVVDDRANGGLSQASLTRRGRSLILGCKIIASDYQWPYCELDFDLRKSPLLGLDLSAMDRVELSARYAQPTDLGIRFQLRNFSPKYSTPDDHGSLKYVALEYFGSSAEHDIEFPVNSLQVPTWWQVEKALPVAQLGPELDNIHYLEIATGNGIKPGDYQLQIDRVAFVGEYISPKLLYLSLLVMWIGAAVLYLLKRLVDQHRLLTRAHNRRRELEAINRMLNFKRKKLEDKLNKDPLTGALNRDGIYRIFNADDGATQGANLSLMFLDLDKFKSINDTYGHRIGDEVLVLFAELIRANTRDTDVFARWGGEEFILVCPNTPLASAVKVAETLCAKIRGKNWPENIPVTCSVGVAEMHSETLEQLIERADQALYRAKHSGRDKVVAAH